MYIYIYIHTHIYAYRTHFALIIAQGPAPQPPRWRTRPQVCCISLLLHHLPQQPATGPIAQSALGGQRQPRGESGTAATL